MTFSLLSLSPETIRNIALYAVSALGPPHEWYSLVLSCQTLHRQLDVPAMHALLFAKSFQASAGAHHLPTNIKYELQRRFAALKLFRRGARFLNDDNAWSASAFTDALWVSYLMLKAEEPRQMNVDQLVWAGLPSLLLLYLRLRLHDGAKENHGWPLCNETNSLVLALMWLLSTEASVKAESAATRDAVMDRIRPYVLAAFRYPLSSVQGWCPGPSSTIKCNPISKTAHGTYPPPTPSTSSREVGYFGRRAVQVPSAPVYAILCYFARLDMLTPMFPEHLQPQAHTPPSASAKQAKMDISGGGGGPRKEDVEHFINECRTPYEPWDNALCSEGGGGFESPEDGITHCLNRTYVPGSLTGQWMGSAIIPCINEYRHWLSEPEAPESMETFCRQPLYLTLQEHFSYDDKKNKRIRGASQSDCEKEVDARLPLEWVGKDNGIEVCDGSSKRFYERSTGEAAHPENIVDVLVTGQTDDPYASAWGAFKIFGRVRLSDGLIVLRRESVAGLGTTILRGYMSSRQHYTGRYRAIDGGCAAADWEAAFSLCKMDG